MTNISDNLRACLRSSHYRLLERASTVTASCCEKLYLAGGAVRDVLLGITPGNLDIVVVRPQAEFADYLAAGIDGEIISCSQFGTYKLMVDGDQIDVATARREKYISPGALPTVEEANIEEDLRRRDFSINSMAVSLNQGSWGELLDLHGGEDDLRESILRVLHDDSFINDPTRILRAIRYSVRLNFRIETGTYQLLKKDLIHLQDISGDRVRNELERMMEEPFACDVLLKGDEEGVLSAIHSGLRFYRTTESTGAKTRKGLKDKDVVLAALIYFSNDAQMSGLGTRLKMETRWSRIVREVRLLKSAWERLVAQDLSRSELFAMLCDIHPAVIQGCAISITDTTVRRSLELYLDELRCIRPSLNGDDLLSLGVQEGPLIGELLDKLLHDRLEGLISTRADEETSVLNRLKGGRD